MESQFSPEDEALRREIRAFIQRELPRIGRAAGAIQKRMTGNWPCGCVRRWLNTVG